MSTDVTPSVMAVHTYSARCGAALVETLVFLLRQRMCECVVEIHSVTVT